jgi:hypothetical protein
MVLASMNLTALPKALKIHHSLHILNAENNEITALDDDLFI